MTEIYLMPHMNGTVTVRNCCLFPRDADDDHPSDGGWT